MPRYDVNIEDLEDLLRRVLGGTYGGPSLSYDESTGEFVLYEWGDAPVSEEEIARALTLEDLWYKISSEM